MLGIENLSLFVVSGILLNLTPGQDTLYIVGRSIGQGKKAGMVSVFGIMTGVLVHTLLAALGLSVVLATSSTAFSTVKYIGAAYLVWIGIGFIKNGGHRSRSEALEPARLDLWKTYRQGLLTNLLNPKVALFFLSFLPQFIDPRTDLAFLSFLVLGLIFFTTGSIWCTVLVYGSSWMTEKFRTANRTGAVLKKLTGALFIGLGLKLALAHAK
jgi:RhtB (resistance to homoserine/threonine) family protein